jgi:hypothetical protein
LIDNVLACLSWNLTLEFELSLEGGNVPALFRVGAMPLKSLIEINFADNNGLFTAAPAGQELLPSLQSVTNCNFLQRGRRTAAKALVVNGCYP